MNEIELLNKIEAAERREFADDHLTEDERKALVNEFLDLYKGNNLVLKDFPFDNDVNSQFVWILYDF